MRILPRLVRPFAGRLSRFVDKGNAASSPEETLEFLEDALATAVRLFGTDGGPTAVARREVAKQLQEMGRFQEAHLLYSESYAAMLRHREPDELATVLAEEWLAQSHLSLGHTDEGRRMYRHVLEVYQRRFGDNDEATLRAKQFLQDIDQGKYTPPEGWSEH